MGQKNSGLSKEEINQVEKEAKTSNYKSRVESEHI
jgi:hypothetical protein